MIKSKKIARKDFLRIGSGIVAALVLWIWYRLTGFQENLENNQEMTLAAEIPNGISYYGRFYIYRNGSSVRAFSTTCTHAGCRLGKNTGDVIQCSCHGSEFDAKTGKPLKGPAFKSLEEFRCQFDARNGVWIVRFQPIGKSNG